MNPETFENCQLLERYTENILRRSENVGYPSVCLIGHIIILDHEFLKTFHRKKCRWVIEIDPKIFQKIKYLA